MYKNGSVNLLAYVCKWKSTSLQIREDAFIELRPSLVQWLPTKPISLNC